MTQLQFLVRQWYFWAIALLSVALLVTATISFILVGQQIVQIQQPVGTPVITLITPLPSAGPAIKVSPREGGPDSLLTVIGDRWQPGETIVIYLEDPTNGRRSDVIDTATVATDGRLRASFAFPQDPFWRTLTGVLITVQSTTLVEASAAYLILPPTPTPLSLLGDDGANPVLITPVPADQVALVTVSQLNLREGPDTTYDVITTLLNGAALAILGQDSSGSWLLVRQADEIEGWVLRAFTNFQGLVAVAAAPPAPPLVPPPGEPAITDWQGEYWANLQLEGEPALVRNDRVVDFNWGEGSPNLIIPNDNFSAHWSRNLMFESGTYLFHIIVDDGASLWVDGQLLIDEWHDGSVRKTSAELALAGGIHRIDLEFYERAGGARIQFWWERINTPTYANWKGEYWSDRNLSGNPILVRDDWTIDFDWGQGAPAAELPADQFSARWSRWVNFREGTYRFRAQADDGLRFYLDGRLVLNGWDNAGGDRIEAIDLKLNGPRWLVVEYNENGGTAKARFWWERINAPLPTETPTTVPTTVPTSTAIPSPTSTQVPIPIATPTAEPTAEPTTEPTVEPTVEPTTEPTVEPTVEPTTEPTVEPTATP